MRLGRPVQTGWHATVPPLHVHTREQFQSRAASALADSKLAPSCAGTNSGAILCTGVATGMSTEVNESGTVCLSDHHWNTTNAGPWSRAQLRMWERLVPSPSYEGGNAWSLVPATNMGTRSRPWHTSPQLIVPAPHAIQSYSGYNRPRWLQPRCNARQVYPISLKEEPHGLGGRATPKQ